MRRIMFALALGLAVSVCAQEAAQPAAQPKPENLVTNGGFEPGADPGGFKLYSKGDKFPGWTITKGSVDHIGTYFKCARGRCLDMHGNNVGAIRQTLATEAGSKYKLTFSLSANPQCGDPKKVLRVTAGKESKTFVVGAKPTIVWSRRSWEFTAEGDKTPLTFEAVGKDSQCGPLLDSVAVTLVPEEPPATESKPQ
jgi:choice-of-anchor C domain-containing protein